jgi:hypothetical protein
MPMDVRGIIGLVNVQLRMGIYQFYSGAMQMDVHGMIQHVKMQLVVGIS